ncbi:WGxxGxxG family protein [Deinococcus pimensis]|uniref:WGxxGxxG family protein n=1 Tax=Deinococcus pimensis TaxID=309888 RepID=UPI0004B23EC4|nr:WGxxGxxG family protein [Deinococcus pimensis]
MTNRTRATLLALTLSLTPVAFAQTDDTTTGTTDTTTTTTNDNNDRGFPWGLLGLLGLAGLLPKRRETVVVDDRARTSTTR